MESFLTESIRRIADLTSSKKTIELHDECVSVMNVLQPNENAGEV